MSEEKKLLHKLAIDLGRDMQDIKDNMLYAEFLSWAEYYNEEMTLEKVSLQISKLTELIFKSNFEGDVTIFDFMPNATQEQKDEANIQMRAKKIERDMMEALR